MLEIINFSKVYENGKIGAKDINIKVERGDIFAFIGHNGAGKTTTIKSIVGINQITSGDILIDNISVSAEPMEAKKVIAYIPDNPDIYESLTGMQYINFVADIYRVSKEDRQALTFKYANMLELTDDLNAPIGTYSHGMKQKLTFISALVHSPKLIVMDEPFVGLDPMASIKIRNAMKEFAKDGGAIFFSTHVLEVAEKLCNKVAIIKRGSIVKQGYMEEIKVDGSLENAFLETADEK